MLSKRRLRDPVEDVPYDLELVPKATGCSLRPWQLPSVVAAAADADVDVAAAAATAHSISKTTTSAVSAIVGENGNNIDAKDGTAASAAAGNGATHGRDHGDCLAMTSTPSPSTPQPPEAMLSGSVLLRVEDREVWSSQVTELLQLCSEAAWRRCEADKRSSSSSSSGDGAGGGSSDGCSGGRSGSVDGGGGGGSGGGGGGVEVSWPPLLALPDAKPLMLEYIADRLDTDDPSWGYQVRTANKGWLQGFVLVTDFTTWCWYFRFDSNAPTSGLTCDDAVHRVTDHNRYGVTDDHDHGESSGGNGSLSGSSNVTRSGDGGNSSILGGSSIPRSSSSSSSSSLAAQLEREPRFGDPEQEGVVFDRVAEVSQRVCRVCTTCPCINV
jgi:hypothetical protein